MLNISSYFMVTWLYTLSTPLHFLKVYRTFIRDDDYTAGAVLGRVPHLHLTGMKAKSYVNIPLIV